jgi:hypothetical protein
MRLAALAAAWLAAAPAFAGTLRCESPKLAGLLYLRMAGGRFELREGSPPVWRDYCRPAEGQERARCRTRRGHLVAKVNGIDTARELEFDPRRSTLVIRDSAWVGGEHLRYGKLRCAPAAPGEGPAG